jgi:hypothetical protein
MSQSHRLRSATTLVDLSPDEVRRLVRPHRGFDLYVQPIIALYRANLDTLRMKGYDPQTTLDEYEAYQSLLAQEQAAQLQLEMVQKTRLMLASNVWGALLRIYARCELAAKVDAVIDRAIVRFRQFMKKAPQKKAAPSEPAEPATPVATPVVTTTNGSSNGSSG